MKKGHKIIKETVPPKHKAMKFSLKVFNTGKALFVSTINYLSMKPWKRVFVYEIMQIKSYITFFSWHVNEA